jgi:predicted MPP superfamily phosphohydrolase
MTDRHDAPAGGPAPPAAVRSPHITRRRFLALGAAGAAALGGDAFLVEPRHLEFTFHAINARTLPEQRQVRFVQITDLHLHSLGRIHRRIAAEVNRLKPDFVLFTGDSVDDKRRLPELVSLLELFDRRTPKYAIAGNREYWGGVDMADLEAIYQRANGRLLLNKSAVHEVGGRGLAVIGLDDLLGGQPDGPGAFGRAAAKGADAHLVMAHCPEHRDRLFANSAFGVAAPPAPPPDFDLRRVAAVLSGHTHGGQVSLFGWSPILPRASGRYVRGWYRDPEAAPLYVCRGIGMSTLPVRFGSPPEVAVFTMWV